MSDDAMDGSYDATASYDASADTGGDATASYDASAGAVDPSMAVDAAAAPVAADDDTTIKDVGGGVGILGLGTGIASVAGGSGAAAAGVAAAPVLATGAVVAAGAAGGALIGMGIEHETHIGEKAGDALYNASNQDDAHAAAVSFDDAGDSLSQGHPIDAAEHAAEGFGHMIQGLWDGPSSDS